MTVTTHTPVPQSTHERRPEAESIRPSSTRVRRRMSDEQRETRQLQLIAAVPATAMSTPPAWAFMPGRACSRAHGR